MDAGSETKPYIAGLDAVRFWAACSVASYHLAFWSWACPSDLPYRASGGQAHLEALAPFTWFGWSGVETFFVISGFVICMSADGSAPYAFLRGRIRRLYPAVWICGSITAAVSLMIGLASPQMIAVAYLRTLAIFPEGPWVDSVYRTLIVEGIFYVLVLGLLVARGFRHVERVAIGLGLYSAGFWLFGGPLLGLVPVAILNFSKYGIFFALGMMAWIAKDRGLTLLRGLVIGLLTAACAVEVYLVACGIAPYWPNPPVIVPVIVWLTSLAVMLFCIAYNGVICRWTRGWARQLRTVGLMTYPLYLLHDVVGSAVLRVGPLTGQAAAVAAAFAVSLGLAYLVVRLEPHVRRPLLAALDRTRQGRGRGLSPRHG